MAPSISAAPLRIVVATSAFSTPFVSDKQKRTCEGCLYDAQGLKIALSQRSGGHSGDHYKENDPDRVDVPLQCGKRLEGRTLYLGHFMGHYGHWLTETMSSFWAIPLTRFDKVAFHPFVFANRPHPFIVSLLAAFGIAMDSVVILREPTLLAKVIVPERSLAINKSANVGFMDAIAEVKRAFNAGRSRGRKLFLSRSRLAQAERSFENADDVDAVALTCGFEVVHPQELSIEDQVRLYAEADVMCGFSGSALHNVLFMPVGRVLVEIGDVRVRSRPLPNQEVCTALAGARHIFAPFPGRAGKEHLADLDRMRAIFRSALA